MFCDQCGGQISPNQSFCAACGKAIARTVVPAPPLVVRGRIASHLQTLGICWIVYSVLRMLTGWMLGHVFSGFSASWAPRMPMLLPGILRGAGIVVAATGVLGLIAGWGLIERQSWARILAIILAIFSLIHIPLGTALGIYTLWVLLPAESAQEYERIARPV